MSGAGIIDCGAPELAALARSIWLEEASQALAGSAPVAVVACAEATTEVQARLAELRAAGAQTLVLARAWPQSALQSIFAGDLARHVLGGARASDAQAVRATLRALLHGPANGAQAWLGPLVAQRRFTIKGSIDREHILDEARALALESEAHPRLVETFCGIADELVTNAVFHAAVGEPPEGPLLTPTAGTPRAPYSKLPRDAAVFLPPAQPATVSFFRDESQLAVCVRDPFGALSPVRARYRLSHAYGKGQDQVATRAGGAGLGLYWAAEAASGLVIHVVKGVFTEAIALLPACASFREAADRGKGISLFFH